MQFLFIDNEKICVYKDGKVSEHESSYIKKYREASLTSAKNTEWKRLGRTEMLLNEGFLEDNKEVFSKLYDVAPTAKEDELVYSFCVNDSAGGYLKNDTSGVYLKYLNDEKKLEAHLITSNQVEFTSLFASKDNLLASIKKGSVAGDIAIFSKDGSEYKSVTAGDSLDENPSVDENGNILFNSYGVARDENNNFLWYSDSEICRLNLLTMEMETVISHQGLSFVKPLEFDGGLYYVKRPTEEKERSNVLLDILMIPVRIVQGIVGFVSAFTTIFSGKPLLSEGKKSNGRSLAKNYKKDEQRLFVMNNLIKVDRELERNQKFADYGFIPRTWKLCRLDANGEKEIFSGVADYCVLEDGTLIFTNGKHLFSFDGEKVKKILDTNCCIKVSSSSPSPYAVASVFGDL